MHEITSTPLQLGSARIDPPLLTASGAIDVSATDADWRSSPEVLGPAGAYVTKTVTRAPRAGNPRPWVELAGDDTLINAVGLANPGWDAVRAGAWDDDIAAVPASVAIVLSLGGTVSELAEMAQSLVEGEPAAALSRVVAIELNLSCPNAGKPMQAADPAAAAEAVAAVVAATDLPVIAKLSVASDIVTVARAAEEAGAAALSVANSMPVRAVSDAGTPILGTASCAMSGAGIHLMSLRAVADVAAAVSIPVIGGGGVRSVATARAMLDAGAAAVSIGTAAAMHPSVLGEVAGALGRIPQL